MTVAQEIVDLLIIHLIIRRSLYKKYKEHEKLDMYEQVIKSIIPVCCKKTLQSIL